LGLLLAAGLAALLLDAALAFWRSFAGGLSSMNIIPFLDRSLLVLMVVEILYTVQVSFTEHLLVPEPFLLSPSSPPSGASSCLPRSWASSPERAARRSGPP
jgi:hypothetical protein